MKPIIRVSKQINLSKIIYNPSNNVYLFLVVRNSSKKPPPSGADRHDKRGGEEGGHLLQGLLHAHPEEVQRRGRGGIHQDHVQGNSTWTGCLGHKITKLPIAIQVTALFALFYYPLTNAECTVNFNWVLWKTVMSGWFIVQALYHQCCQLDYIPMIKGSM